MLMDKEKLESMMIEFVDGTLPEKDRVEMELLISTQPETAKLYEQTKQLLQVIEKASPFEPASSAKSKFEKEIQAMLKEKETKIVSFNRTWVYRMAAGI